MNNILQYYKFVDHAFILDNSKLSHEDDIRKLLEGKFESHYTYRHFDKNIGLCRAMNYGMKEALEAKYDWALLMDADSVLQNDIVSLYKRFLEMSSENNIAVLAPVHLYDRSKNHLYEGVRSVKWAMTSGCFYHVGIFEMLHGFKEELFVDGLDMDYCYKARQNGFQILEMGAAGIKHHPAETRFVKLGSRVLLKYGYASPWRYYMQARALVWVILRYRSYIDIVTYVYKWFKVILLFDNKSEFVKQMIKGSKEGISLWREEKSDKEI